MAAGAANQPSGSPVPGLMGAPGGDTTEHGRRTAQGAPSWALWRKKRPYLAHTAPLMRALISIQGRALKDALRARGTLLRGPWEKWRQEPWHARGRAGPASGPSARPAKAPPGRGAGRCEKGCSSMPQGDGLFRKPSMRGLPGDSCILTSGAGTRSPERRYL